MATATAFIFLGPDGDSRVERWMSAGRLAAARDAIRMLASQPQVSRIVCATPDRDLAEAHRQLPVVWDFDPPDQAFHFGHRLAELVAKYPAPVCLYLGAGSAPLLPSETLAQAVQVVMQSAPCAVTNNLHSSDWIVLNCPALMQSLAPQLERDNALGWVLAHEAGVDVRALPPSAATRMDLDTPADLLLLGLHPRAGPEVRAHLQAQEARRWRAAGRRMFTPGRQVALIGRVSSAVWSHIESRTQVWVRVFSEERGMAASGRQAAGQVRSLIGAMLERAGPEAFFAELSQMAEAVIFDTRVVLAHRHAWPSAADRYASDLGLADEVQDPFLRSLTAAANSAPMPVVLGGHGVVAGDMYALIEIAEAGALDPL